MTKVAIYARYSTDMQRAASIEDQIRVCEERADKEGWAVHNCYTDHGQSGATLLRPGIQMLLQDALAGHFEIIVAEALDRLSRDQADIAGIYKRLNFAGVKILTLAEGEVNDLHIGLKGTMNALYLKDLADKTRRGLRGRVEAGKSGGGNAYGYDVVRKFTETGEAIRGDRTINEAEAAIVNRIFEEYASGESPRAIAKRLNAEDVAGPSGKTWGPSTIHGNRQRGTGILNNELYIGRLVWNRLRYIKDPETGKRVSRLNDEADWIIQDVPEMRIVDQDLWDRVKARQGALKAKTSSAASHDKDDAGYWDRRRPRYLFSGLMKCGACGGGVVNLNAHRIGCAAARNKGTCDNTRTLKRDDVEAAILNGLRNHLMDPELFSVFCEEYTRHLNKLRIEHNAARSGMEARLAKIERELDKLVQAICEGIPAAKVKDKMWELENQKAELEAKLKDTQEEPVLIHPNMAASYRDQVAALHDALNDKARRAEAVDITRSLVDKIVLTPTTIDGKDTLAIDLHGHLAGILSLAAKTKKPLTESDFSVESTKLVAGTGFEFDRPDSGETAGSTKLVAGAIAEFRFKFAGPGH
ncbi:recombinase family protein [Thalassospira profundimaris]|uniref:recombinase family protein n=1 Tax=Thalassospira profundimaris TaxID=502049 RepID=UPI000DED9B40|nr:recombinase family protein [Thalassospira profundimaris]